MSVEGIPLAAKFGSAGDETTLKPVTLAGLAAVLAPELLAIIFREVIVSSTEERRKFLPEDENLGANEFDTKPLLSLSHVCRYWREVALGTPSLWTRIHGGCLDQMEAFLERSRSLALSLLLDVEHYGGMEDGPMHTRGASIIKVQGQRLRWLDLVMVPTRAHVAPLLSSLYAPRLECLTITSACSRNKCIETEISWTPLITDQASSLRAFAMVPLLSFDGLTALCHPFDILRLLSNTPELNFFHVDCLFNSVGFGDDRQPPSNPIPLHHLHSLVFTQCWYNLVHTIISHLVLSEDVFVRLQNILELDGHPAPLPPLALRPVTALDIAIGSTDILMVADGPTSGLWLSGYHDGAHAGWVSWVGMLPSWGCLALAHVTHLRINVDLNPADGLAAFWNEFLAHLPRVTHLAVVVGPENSDPPSTRYAATTVLSRALAPDESDEDSPLGRVPCPTLDTLTVEWTEAMAENEVASYGEFPRMLAARGRAGHAIRRVVMQTMLDSQFSEAQAQDFFQELRSATEGYETAYELLVKEEIGAGVGGYEMRDVWRADHGEEQYWKMEDEEKPHYTVPEDIGGYSWTGVLTW